jgi:hypothetical protein
MTEIILTSDQVQQFTSATDGVVFRDGSGSVVVRVPPILSAEEHATVVEAKRRLNSDSRRVPSPEVLERIGIRGNG